ncbi:MAG: hypothetical protein Q4E67_01620 [Planctomycetia bacterium]|nr:hypothetical protein [Planctomycetia bacterium]
MMSAKITALRIWEHWKRLGRPAYVQFDNGTVFSGPPKPNVLGRVVRMCLELGTSVVFSIPRETGPQACVERFNGLWERTLWNRFEFQNMERWHESVNEYVAACRQKHTQPTSLEGSQSRRIGNRRARKM